MSQLNFIKTSQTIVLGLMMGVTTFTAVIMSTLTPTLTFNTDFEKDNLMLIAMVFSVGSVFMSKFMYNLQFKDIEVLDLNSKKTKFQTAVIISNALLEGPGLFSAGLLMISGNLYYLIFVVLAIVLMLITFPTGFKFVNDCRLTREEKDKLGL